MNPSILLSLIHDLQAKIVHLQEVASRYEEEIEKLKNELENEKGDKKD